jgi:hypothetical protein
MWNRLLPKRKSLPPLSAGLSHMTATKDLVLRSAAQQRVSKDE